MVATILEKRSRIYSFDLIRGALIFYVIFLHAILQRVFSSQVSSFEVTVKTLPLAFVIGISPLIILALWGSAFSLVTGATAVYSMQMKLSEANSSTKLKQITANRLIHSVLLYGVHLINNFLFATRSIEHGFVTNSLITGYFETGTLVSPTFFSLSATSTIEIIALVNFIMTMIVYIAYRRRKNQFHSLFSILLKIGIAVLIISVIFQELVSDPRVIQEYLLTRHHYVLYYIMMRLFFSRFALFPIIAFGCFGGLFALMLKAKKSFRAMASFGLTSGFVLIGLFIYYILQGFAVIPQYTAEITPIPLHLFNLGLQCIVLTVLFRVFDYSSPARVAHRVKRVQFLFNYSRMSLTIFLLEPLIAAALYRVFLIAYGGSFGDNFILIVVFITTLLIVWGAIMWGWGKISYRFSIEWTLTLMQHRFSEILQKWTVPNIQFWTAIKSLQQSYFARRASYSWELQWKIH